MSTFIRSLIGTVFRVFLASLVFRVGVVTAADASAEAASDLLLQSDIGASPVQILAEHSSDTSLQIGSEFWASASDDTAAIWLDVPNRYIEPIGFYLEGVDQRQDGRWPGRTGASSGLNTIQRHPGQDAVKPVTVTGIKPPLNANLSLDRSTREGWAVNGNVVGTLPEPGTLLLMGLGLLGLGLARRRAAKKAA